MGSIASHNLLLFGFPSCLDFAAAFAAAAAVVVMRFWDFLDFVCFVGDKWLTKSFQQLPLFGF